MPVGQLLPISGGVDGQRFNFDGVLTYSRPQRAEGAEGYVQMFRSGAIEAVDAYILGDPMRTGTSHIPSVAYERDLIEATSRYMRLLAATAGVEPPIFAMLSMLGVRGFKIITDYAYESHPIDRDNLILPESLLEDYAMEATALLRPAFDVIWQSCGYAASGNYDTEGAWAPRQ